MISLHASAASEEENATQTSSLSDSCLYAALNAERKFIDPFGENESLQSQMYFSKHQMKVKHKTLIKRD